MQAEESQHDNGQTGGFQAFGFTPKLPQTKTIADIMHGNSLVFWFIGLVVAGFWAASTLFSRDARVRRRRRKSHGRLISKRNRPMVRFNVRPPKK